MWAARAATAGAEADAGAATAALARTILARGDALAAGDLAINGAGLIATPIYSICAC